MSNDLTITDVTSSGRRGRHRPPSDFGLRIWFGFRISDFGFSTTRLFCLTISSLALITSTTAASPNSHPTFERDVRPVLKAHCFQCHGEGDTLKGGVDLRLRRLMLTNTPSGTVLVPGKPHDSLLWEMV